MRRALGAGLGVVLALAGGCTAKKPSVLLISIDSLRADVMGRRVASKPVAPALEALAGASLDYARCTSAAPWTSPSMMSIMTGMPPAAHGLVEHDRALASTVPTLAERFKAAGYRTAAVVPALTLRPEYGFGRGFETYDFQSLGHDVVTSPELTSKLLNHLDRLKGDTFFAWIHFWDPHYNYIPPAPWDAAFRQGARPAREDVQCLKWIENPLQPDETVWLRGQYDGEIGFTDRHVHDILEHLRELGRDKDTIVIVVGDHGEAFQEHGWLGHTLRVDEEMVRVPLLVRWPGHLAHERLETPVSTTQIARTVLALAGLPADDFGLSAALPRAGQAPAAPEPVLSETMRMGCFTSLSDGKLKYVLDHRTCREALFDLAADPGEQHDLAALDPAGLAAKRGELQRRLEAIDARRIPKAALPPALVNEAEAALRSIGYVAAGGKPGQKGEIVCAALPDPSKYKRDAFGDVEVYQPCPSAGAEACLKKAALQR